jgi:two-component system sensor histidine kinase and response regulator WspE
VKKRASNDLGHLSMQELFRVEAENQTALLTNGLLALERTPASPEQLEALMRAAHSFKGAARIVNLTPAVQVAHAMEDCFVAAQQQRLTLTREHIDALLRGVDWLTELSRQNEPDVVTWESQRGDKLQTWLERIRRLIPGADAAPTAEVQLGTPELKSDTSLLKAAEISVPAEPQTEPVDRVLRLTAENLNRLLALAGESLVESRWLRQFSESLQRLKRMQSQMESTLDSLRQQCDSVTVNETIRARFHHLSGQAAESRAFLSERLQDLDLYDRRAASLSNRLYLEVLRTRMRPFADGVQRFPRMVRDLARGLGKQVRLELKGETTQVDRDILDRLEAPLAHLLRNAVDHGCEAPEVRKQQGKPVEGVIGLEARHSAGLLQVVVTDDGPGLDLDRVREIIVRRKLTTPAIAEKMTETELLQFLFLPGFTLKDTVTELSGRGVGLDVVQNMVKALRGSVRVSTTPGAGMRFQLHLPITLSVLRTLLVEIGGEPYAFPLAQISSTLKLSRDRIESLEGRHHFQHGEQYVGLLAAHQVFEYPEPQTLPMELPVVVLGERNNRYGLLVDRFLGERELVVQPLDSRLGKIKDISAAALMEDGAPVLIVDVDDVLRSIEKLITSGVLANVGRGMLEAARQKRKRVLIVDDSLTVRELERKLLETAGYAADVAVDGMDGWNAIRSAGYDLVITDVDMPRMDGIELTSLIKQDQHLQALPVLIVSYKDREEDRIRGLNAGADYYLTKGSFHDATLIQAVVDLIGEAEA